MRKNRCLVHVTNGAILTTLLVPAMAPMPAGGQPALPQPTTESVSPQTALPLTPPPLPLPYQAQQDQNQADPPSRVGRVAGISGIVSFRTQGDRQWTSTGLNYPISAGDTFWTEPSARAQLEFSDSRIVLAPTTEITIAALDTDGLQAIAAQGEAYIHLRGLAANEAWAIQTPRGLVRLNGNGRYHIVVGSTEQPTQVTVVDGSADVEGPGLSLKIRSDETAAIDGIDNFQDSVGPAERAAFLTAELDSEQPRVIHPAPVPIPPQVAAMPGGTALTGYGNWARAPDYGQIWYPPVATGWIPYRDGHWAYIAPWGWTWIDNAPWGFAPSHYGRWVEIGGRWAWTPGTRLVTEPPVYAPALVTFLGISAGVAVGATLAAHHIGWVPLGPREPFHPWYHCSDGYVRNVNINHITNIGNHLTFNNFVNRTAATWIPAAAMIGSRSVQSLARPIDPQAFAAAHPLVGQPPLQPTQATEGLTPTVLRRFNLPPDVAQVAPGPPLHLQPTHRQSFHTPPFPAGTPGLVEQGFRSPGQLATARPNLRPAGAGLPIQPIPMPPPLLTTPDVRTAGPVIPRIIRPTPSGPDGLHRPEPAFVQPPLPLIGSQPAGPPPRVTPNQAVGIQPALPFAPVPHQDRPRAAPPAPLPQVQRFALPPGLFRPDPPRITAPSPPPHLAPQHFAPPAAAPQPLIPLPSRPEPTHFLPLQRDRRPG